MKGIFSVKSVPGWFFFVFCLCLRVCSFSQVLGHPLRMSFVRADEMRWSLVCVRWRSIGWRMLVRWLQRLSSQSVDGVIDSGVIFLEAFFVNSLWRMLQCSSIFSWMSRMGK